MRAISYLFLKFVFLGAVVTFTACATRNSQEEVVPDVVEDAAVDSSAMNFQFPLKNFKRLGRGFKKKHKGIDISADKNTPILASESGWVTYAGRRFKGFGKLVIIEHSKVWATFYGHLNTYAVEQGKWVNKGDVIGYVGSTGRSTGYHLHFEIRRSHVPIDPMIYFYNDNLKIGSN